MAIPTTRHALITLAAAVALAGCAPDDVLQLQLGETSGLKEETAVLLDGAPIGKVTHLRFARTGSAGVAELTLQPEAFARLDPDTIWVVRPADGAADDAPPVVRATNLCVAAPRGLARRADVQGHGGPLFRMLPAIASSHEACLGRVGGFGALRKAIGAPAGLGAAVRPGAKEAD